MDKKMSNKEKILEMLKGNELTVREIAQDLNLKENAVNVYICRLRKDNLIKKVGKINRYNVYTTIKKESINPLRYLKELHSIMNNRMDFIEKPNENEIQTIKTIEEMIK